MPPSMRILRSFHHKGACKGELAVARKGLGTGAIMLVCARMRSGEGPVGVHCKLVRCGLSIQVPVTALGQAPLGLELELF